MFFRLTKHVDKFCDAAVTFCIPSPVNGHLSSILAQTLKELHSTIMISQPIICSNTVYHFM